MESKPCPHLSPVTCRSSCFTADAFDYLDAPVLRVTGADIPTPYATNLEDLAFPTAQNVIRTVKGLLNVQ